tara:strand:+ start:218 stop:337 length:120 start_codon:yes stop_codon:yes gene_type:complete
VVEVVDLLVVQHQLNQVDLVVDLQMEQHLVEQEMLEDTV